MENLYKVNPASVTVEKERAAFITFWLWLGIIMNVISAPFTILQLNGMSNLGYLGMELITRGVDITPFINSVHPPQYALIGVAILSAIIYISGYALLLKWKKKGFLIIAIAALINIIVNFICYPMIQDAYFSIGLTVDLSMTKYVTVIGACFSIFILWLILQIKKNGVSCWSLLE